MRAIDTYVDNLFTGLPTNKEANQMKENIKADLNEKYDSLLKQGKNEDEALGIICKQFGSMEEIKYELCIDELLDNEKIENILVDKRARNERLAFGIVCFICAIASLIWIEEVLMKENYGVLAFMLFVAAGIYYVITSFSYTFTDKDLINYDEAEKKDKKKRSRFKFSDLIPLSVFAYLFIGFFYGGWHPWWIIIPGSGVLFPMLDKWFGLK